MLHIKWLNRKLCVCMYVCISRNVYTKLNNWWYAVLWMLAFTQIDTLLIWCFPCFNKHNDLIIVISASVKQCQPPLGHQRLNQVASADTWDSFSAFRLILNLLIYTFVKLTRFLLELSYLFLCHIYFLEHICPNDAHVLPDNSLSHVGDFPTSFHLPSRRSVRRRLLAQPGGIIIIVLLIYAFQSILADMQHLFPFIPHKLH